MDNHVHGPTCGCADFMFNEIADDLLNSIDIQSLECLNEAQQHSCKLIFRTEDQKLLKHAWVESDLDAELLLIIPFLETVRIRSINIISLDQNSAPNNMKAYINCPNVDFQLVETQPLQEFALGDNLSGEYGCAVNISKFENVNKLALYIRSQNQVNDPIRISYIGIKGIKTEMKRQLVNTMYELIPLPKETDPTKNTQFQNVF